jgi:hypothetical protein
MFFNKQTKQAFIFPPKTGTITVRHFLGAIGWKGLTPHHQTTEEWIKTYPVLEDYNIYGFLRDPLKRFESAILHIKQFPMAKGFFAEFLKARGIEKTAETVTYEELCGIHSDLIVQFEHFFRPQAIWLDHPKVTILDFRNMEAELRRITGNTEQPLVRYNTSTDFGRSVITPAVGEFVRQHYADDYRLWDTLNGA